MGRTTIRLEPDVEAAAEQLRRERHLTLSEAVNELARSGLHRRTERRPVRLPSAELGLRVDVADIAEALDLLDGTDDA